MIDERADRSIVFPNRTTDLLEHLDFLRLDVGGKQEKSQKSALGQFFTPAPIARLMISMLNCQSNAIHILDAGAGIGTLFATCVAHLCEREKRPAKISVTAYEIDKNLIGYLHTALHLCELLCTRADIEFIGEAHQQDFILAGVEMLQKTLFSEELEKPKFNCAILNPPYKKIQTKSDERKLLKTIGIESSNLYAGFLSLATRLLEPGGELVAITPRSFCNGPYFKSFRQYFLQKMSLQHIHTFGSRKKIFDDDHVLQENIIFHAVKESNKPQKVSISSNTDPLDEFTLAYKVRYDQIVHSDDPQLFIHIIQDNAEENSAEDISIFQTSLEELGATVSTGKVVDFRTTDFLCTEYQENTVPLLFPTHIGYGSIHWPKPNGKKPNALLDTPQTKRLQLPNEYYVLVKRFTTKEEKKRIVAAVYNPLHMPGSYVSFENRLNYFHRNGKGLNPELAKGLALYLNSTLVDSYFRQFNGHTQVNAADLKNIKYPTLQQLETLGRKISSEFPDQAELDNLIREELLCVK